MTAMDRRNILKGILGGAAVATVGFSIMPNVAEALPLAADDAGAAKPDGLVEKDSSRRRWTARSPSSPRPRPPRLLLAQGTAGVCLALTR